MDFSTIAQIARECRERGVNDTISPADTMANITQGPAPTEMYLKIGQSGLDNILASLAFSRLESVKSILDMACGHGRVGRFLRAAFPDAKITFSDIDPEATAFCASTFDGHGIPSKHDLRDVTFGDKFDLIWVGSLFTHVDEARTRLWLQYLCDSLTDDGIVVASFHGVWHLRNVPSFLLIDETTSAQILSGYRNSGFGYGSYSRDIGMGDVGISICSPSKLLEIATSIPNCRVISFTERGWADSQDLLTIAKTDRMQQWAPPRPL
jgi:SAM-dependent methyltransferase